MTTYRKIQIIECVGTGDNASESYLHLDQLNTSIFEHTIIRGYRNAIFPLNISVNEGVTRVREKIQATPGRFVLVGTSQGAQIMSEVYKVIRNGPRAADCVGVFLFANPLRQEGRAFPGASHIPPGHGVAPAELRLTDETDLVWEIAQPGDPVATNGDDYIGQQTTEIYRFLMTEFHGSLADLLNPIGVVLGAIGNVAGLANLALGMLVNHATVQTDAYKPIDGDPRSGVQIVMDHLNNVIGPKHAHDYVIPSGVDIAQPSLKPTFFYANGTSTVFDIFGSGVLEVFPGLSKIDSDPFPTLLDPSIWNYKRIYYPAAFLNVTGGNSVQEGVDAMVQAIKDTAGPVAIGGYSQGALVASRVYDEFRNGRLKDRKADLLAGITFGNPVRPKDHNWPGSRSNTSMFGSPSGHGVFPEDLRLKDPESFWWDFSLEFDLYSSVGDSPLEQAFSQLAALLLGRSGPLDLLGIAANLIANFPSAIQAAMDFLGGLLGIADNWVHRGMTVHGLYGSLPPTGYPEGSKSCYQLAIDYLNGVGAAWRSKAIAAASTPVQQLPTQATTPSAGQVTQAPAPFAWLGTLLADGTNAVEAALGTIFNNGGITQLQKDLQSLIDQSSVAVGSALSPILRDLQSGAPVTTVLTQLQNFFGNSTTTLLTWWNSQINGWYQQLTTFIGQSNTWLQNLLAQGERVVEDVLGTVLTTGQHAIESAVNSFANGLTAANAGLQELLRSVVTAVNNGTATLHNALSSLELIAKSNLFEGAAAELNKWWNSTVDAWFKNVNDIFGLPVSSKPVDTQKPTPITDITDPSFVAIQNDVESMVLAPPPTLTNQRAKDARAAILSGDPLAASQAAWEIAQAQQTPSTEIVVTFYNKLYQVEGECHDYKNLTYTFARNQIGTGTIILKHTDPLVPVVMRCHEEVVPVTIQNGSMRWSGRVEYVDYQMKEGQYDVTVYLTDDYQWFDRILCWPNFLLPIQTQFPQRSLFIGPAITCIKTLIAEQAFRLQSGIWEFVNNLGSGNLDWQSWFGNILESDGDPIKMLMTPIVVVPTNPLFDTSPWTSINGRMDKISTLVEQVVKDCGLVLTANLWLPGDPQPDGLFVPLYAPTILVDVKDMSGITGPTGTFIDGIVRDTVDLEHGVLGDVLSPFLNPANNYAPEGVNIAPLLGVNFEKPWVLFHDHPRGGLREFHLVPHAPTSHSIIGGGKSPKWVNDLINATLEWMIDAIEIAVGFTGVPNTLLDGTFDDIILAFQQIENSTRRTNLGPYGFPETFQQTGASAYTLDEWFALQSAMWDTRGYHGIICSFDNGFPYTIGKDLFVGALASFAIMGKLYTDYVERITITDDVNSRVKAEVMIGDGKSHENPVTRIQRHMTKFQEAFNIVTMSTN